VERLLRHSDWRVRSSALDVVWSGVGATDEIDGSIKILVHDPDEDVRAEAALASYEASRGTANEVRVNDAFSKAANTDQSDYVRDAARNYLRNLSSGQ
jgi:HEAT repeat protein